MSPEFSSLITTLLEALTPVVAAGVSYLGLLVTRWVSHRVKSERAQHAIMLAHAAVSDVVVAGGSAFRRELLKAMADGVLTAEEREHIRRIAIAEAKAQAGHEVIAALGNVTRDPDAWLWTKIRAAVDADVTARVAAVDPQRVLDAYRAELAVSVTQPAVDPEPVLR